MSNCLFVLYERVREVAMYRAAHGGDQRIPSHVFDDRLRRAIRDTKEGAAQVRARQWHFSLLAQIGLVEKGRNWVRYRCVSELFLLDRIGDNETRLVKRFGNLAGQNASNSQSEGQKRGLHRINKRQGRAGRAGAARNAQGRFVASRSADIPPSYAVRPPGNTAAGYGGSVASPRERPTERPVGAFRVPKLVSPTSLVLGAPGHDGSGLGLLSEKTKKQIVQNSKLSAPDDSVGGHLARLPMWPEATCPLNRILDGKLIFSSKAEDMATVATKACLACRQADRQRVLGRARREGLDLAGRQAAIEQAERDGLIGGQCTHGSAQPAGPPAAQTVQQAHQQPCASCVDADIAALHQKFVASDQRRLAVKGAQRRGELGAACRHRGRSDEDASAQRQGALSQRQNWLLELMAGLGPPPKKKGAGSEPPPKLTRPSCILVECGDRSAFLEKRSLRAIGLRLRHVLFAVRRLRRDELGVLSSAELARRVVGYAKACQEQAAESGVDDPEPRSAEHVAEILAPDYFAKFGTGNRDWMLTAAREGSWKTRGRPTT